MSTTWAIVAIVGAFLLGMIVGAIIVAAATGGGPESTADGGVGASPDGTTGGPDELRTADPDASTGSAESGVASRTVRSTRPKFATTSVAPPGDAPNPPASVASVAPAPLPGYVITSVGDPEPDLVGGTRLEFKPRPQFDQVARTVMIEAASLVHGVRNALSEENRAKISYEIKRELIRVRKDRRAEVKQALREYRAKHRAAVQPDAEQGEGSRS